MLHDCTNIICAVLLGQSNVRAKTTYNSHKMHMLIQKLAMHTLFKLNSKISTTIDNIYM